MTVWVILMFLTLMVLLMVGYPVAFTLGSVALLFGSLFLGVDFFQLLPLRIWGIMTNFMLLAVPLFIFMGIIMNKAGLAEDLLETMGLLFGIWLGRALSPVGSDRSCCFGVLRTFSSLLLPVHPWSG